jgi:hypothetical protein
MQSQLIPRVACDTPQEKYAIMYRRGARVITYECKDTTERLESQRRDLAKMQQSFMQTFVYIVEAMSVQFVLMLPLDNLLIE